MGDEIDYMSDDLLASCAAQDVRPGLIKNHNLQRDHEIHKRKIHTDRKNKEAFRPFKEVEAERRNEGLQQSLGEQNKGFAMLQKMGYKAGQAIGKSGTGRIEPIEVTLKTDRMGLGRETVLREIAQRKIAARARYMDMLKATTNVDDFRKRMNQKVQERLDESDLRKSQRICEDLDRKKDLEEPVEKWFWPKIETEDEGDEEEEEKDENDDDDDDIEFETDEKLEILTKYLRTTHLYCIWCGAVYDDDKDLRDSCPGVTRDDH